MPTRNLYFASYSLIICKLQDVGFLLAQHSPYRQANKTKDRTSQFGRHCKNCTDIGKLLYDANV